MQRVLPSLRLCPALTIPFIPACAGECVLPRITSPTLTPQDVQQLDLVDLAALGTEVLGFFMSKADRANLPQSPSA